MRWCSGADLHHLVERVDRTEQLVGNVPADDRHRPARIDFSGADQPPALDVERGEVDVIARHAADLDAVDRLVAEAEARVRLRLRRDGTDVVAVAPDGGRLADRDSGIVPHPFLVGFRPHDRHALNREVVGADARNDGVADVGVHALDERHDGNDRGHGHDVAEHRQERAELVRPDRLKRDRRRLEEIGHFAVGPVARGACSILTAAPSASVRTDANGPTITLSPSFRPLVTSKYFSPAMPVLIGSNTALPSRTTKTPSSSFRSCPGFSSEAWTVVPDGGRRARASPARARRCPCRRAPSRAPSLPGSARPEPGCGLPS